jgi:hypothetical protein
MIESASTVEGLSHDIPTDFASELDWPVSRLIDFYVCDGEAFYLVEWENTMIPLGTEHWLSQAVIGDVSLIDLATSCDIVDDMVVVEWVNVNDLGGAVEAVQRYWLDIVESTRQVNSRLCVTEVMLIQDV